MTKYPDAKIILTVRDPEKWYKSAYDTIFQMPKGMDKMIMRVISVFKPELRHIINTLEFANDTVWKGLFQNRFADKAFAIDIYNKWNEEVKNYVPKEKLLVFEVKDGWEPLCAFLNKPVPSTPFPRVNDTQEFIARKKRITK